jgi:hypothetical protein
LDEQLLPLETNVETVAIAEDEIPNRKNPAAKKFFASYALPIFASPAFILRTALLCIWCNAEAALVIGRSTVSGRYSGLVFARC